MALISTKDNSKIYVDVPSIVSHYQVSGFIDRVNWSGQRDIQARCPSRDHDDNSPSWGINGRTGRHQCFGCGWKGDVLLLIRELESLKEGKDIGFSRTIEIALRISSEGSSDIQSGQPHAIRRYRAMDDRRELRYYPDSILNDMEDKYDYFLERGINHMTCKNWQLKYNLSDDRYIVPVRDMRNSLVGFIGIADNQRRDREKDNSNFKKVKYSPGLLISKILLGAHRYELFDNDKVILVEGAVDCLKVASALGSIYPVMAILHSQLSSSQVKILKEIGYRSVLVMPDQWKYKNGQRVVDDPDEKFWNSAQHYFKNELVEVVKIEYDGDDPGDTSLENIRESVMAVKS